MSLKLPWQAEFR